METAFQDVIVDGASSTVNAGQAISAARSDEVDKPKKMLKRKTTTVYYNNSVEVSISKVFLLGCCCLVLVICCLLSIRYFIVNDVVSDSTFRRVDNLECVDHARLGLIREYYAAMENLTGIPFLPENNMCEVHKDLLWNDSHPLDYHKQVIPFHKDCKKHFYLGNDQFLFICKNGDTGEIKIVLNYNKFNPASNIFHGTNGFFELNWLQFCSLLSFVDKVVFEMEDL